MTSAQAFLYQAVNSALGFFQGAMKKVSDHVTDGGGMVYVLRDLAGNEYVVQIHKINNKIKVPDTVNDCLKIWGIEP